MNKFYKISSVLILLLVSNLITAQEFKIFGTVTDATTKEKLIGANVYIADLNTGAATNTEGSFSIDNVKEGTYEVAVTYIGYLRLVKNIKVSKNQRFDFVLEPSSVLLEETVVKGTKAVLRETPVAFSEVKGEEIEFKLASRDIPQELATTPSVFSSVQGGASGDATLFVRGFSQRNVAVMINGVPINDMENKWVYWSNWAGLGDVLDNTQIQRGIGASPYSVSAVGGVMNMVTKGVATEQEFIKVRSEYGTNNLIKGSVAFNQKLSNSFAVTALFAKRTWDGYAVGTYYKDWTYFVSIGGVFGNHSLQLTGIGSPQEHGQRPYSYAQMTIADWAKYGKTFNYAVGRLRGQWFNEVVNKFYKPAFNLDWNWQINAKSTLSTIFYYSQGTGYGSATAGPYAQPIINGPYINYRDYDLVWSKNSTFIDPRYSSTLHRSASTILVNSVNNHNWYGILSTFKTQLSPELVLNTGIDGRYYIGDHYREVRDLIGGDYYVDNSDVSSPNRMCVVGDKVSYYDDYHIRQFGGFGQLEYKSGPITTFINLSASSQGAQRIEFFLYKTDSTTAWQNFFGYTAKTGINYNIDEHNNVYANIGYFSTAPLVGTIFANYSNAVSRDANNEKVLGLELGYGLATKEIAIKANGFYTQWWDRALPNISVVDPIEQTTQYVNVYGAKQLHTGLELEMAIKVLRGLEFRASGSLINAKYQNNVSAIISPENNPSVVKQVNLYTEGLYVSEFPMQQVSLQLNYRISLGYGINVFINPVYKFTGKYFSYYDPDTRSAPTYDANHNVINGPQSWQIPDLNMFDLHIGFSLFLTDLFIKKINANFHVFNLFNNPNNIVYGRDGADHTAATAKVFYGQDRWYNIALAFTF